MRFSVFQMSRQGGRKTNEDRMGYCYTRESAVLMLADGLGGHPEGEVAASIAVETGTAMFQKMAQPKLADVADFLGDAMMAAHFRILQYGMGKAMPDSPRTTLVVAVIQSGQASWAHCGDSRLYMVRQHQLLSRTQDHSFAERGCHPQDAAPSASAERNRNVLFSCLGSPIKPVFSVAEPVVLQHDDKLMLCSDGLWAILPEHDIVSQLSQQTVEAAVQALVEQALMKAGARSDNVTCVALGWRTPDPPATVLDDFADTTSHALASPPKAKPADGGIPLDLSF